jgi:integrase
MGAHAATKVLDRARPATGLKDFRIHDLRRTAATRMAELGISPHTISLVLNHASVPRPTDDSRVSERRMLKQLAATRGLSRATWNQA